MVAADKRGVTRSQPHIHDSPRKFHLAPNSGSIAAMRYLTSMSLSITNYPLETMSTKKFDY